MRNKYLALCTIAALSLSVVPLTYAAKMKYKLPEAVTDADYYDNGHPDNAKVQLGKVLFYDKITGGNKDISCATCHHDLTASGDGLSLGVGAGGRGLGVTRDTGSGQFAIRARIPRNAQPLFNIGAKSFTAMFHDGRVEIDPKQPGVFKSEVGNKLPANFDNVLAVQAMFPVTVPNTMPGKKGQNPVADAAEAGKIKEPGGVWDLLGARLRENPEYVEMFTKVFGIKANEINFVYASNAMAAFEAYAWRADKSPFDQYLRGDKDAMTKVQKRGMNLFYGKANCASCHNGKFQTDNLFHAIAMPQIGPGKGVGYMEREDYGREFATKNVADRYKFRTPSLRNIVLTGPWGHGGAYNTLEGVVRHHLDPVASLKAYDCKNEPLMPSRPDLDAIDCLVQNNAKTVDAIAKANELAPVKLSKKEMGELMAFLGALTDPASLDMRANVPKRVPSGLPMAE